MVSLGVVVLIRVCPGRSRVHSGSLGCVLEVFGFIRCFGYIRVRRGRHLVHSRSLSAFVCALGFIGFIRGRWVHLAAPWGTSDSFGGVRFIRVRLGGRWVH